MHSGTGTLSAIDPANVAILAPNDTATFTSTYEITQADIDAGNIILNIAKAHGTPPGPIPLLPPTAYETVIPTAPAPKMTIQKSADIKSDVSEGETITYTYKVTNTGNVNITDVHITDVHNGTGTLSAITPVSVNLAPGDSQDFNSTYVVTQNDVYLGKAIINTATAHGRPLGPVPLLPPQAQETVTLESVTPAMTIQKSANKKTNITVGETITYTYTVTNTGNVDIHDVNVTDVHNGAGPLSAIAPANVVILVPGDIATFTSTYKMTQDDINLGVAITNIATAHGTPSGPVPLLPPKAQEVITPALGIPAMTIEKSANKKSNFKAGDTIIYTYLVTNTGNVNIDTVSVTDEHNGTGTLSPITPASVDLAPGNSQDFTATYVVTHDDIDAGVAITNIATAHGTPKTGILIPPKDKEIVTPEPPKPGIALIKTASVGGTGAVGDIITYRFAVTNTGNVELNDINISDLLPGLVLSGNPITSLAPGVTDSTSITGTYTITQTDINNGSIVNQATATGTTTSGKIVKDRSDHTDKTKDRPTSTPVLAPVPQPPVSTPTPVPVPTPAPVPTPPTDECGTAMDGPIAHNDYNRSKFNKVKHIVVLKNDEQRDLAIDRHSVRLIDADNNEVLTFYKENVGTWIVDTDTGEVLFDPDHDFMGSASVPYIIRDICGNRSNEAIMQLCVSSLLEIDSQKVLITEYGNTCMDIEIDSNRIGPDGLEAVKIEFIQPNHGRVTHHDGGTPKDPTDDKLCYLPEPNYNGKDEFTYQITGLEGITCPKKVIMDVQCASTQRSDSGDALENISIMIMMMLMGMLGLYYIRREELNNKKGEL